MKKVYFANTQFLLFKKVENCPNKRKWSSGDYAGAPFQAFATKPKKFLKDELEFLKNEPTSIAQPLWRGSIL